MQISGLLVEYLINGSVALIWLVPLLLSAGLSITVDNAFTLALFVPGLYVLGMAMDYLAVIFLNPHKRRIRLKVEEKLKPEKTGVYEKVIDLLLNAPELAKADDMRSSRDRVARGSVINALLATASLTLYVYQKNASVSPLIVILLGLVVTVLCWAMWARYQRSSYQFHLQAWRMSKQKSKRS